MGILSRLFGTRSDPENDDRIIPAGVLRDEDGWYYEESQDFSSTQRSLRIDQDRPGNWYVHKSFCEVEGLNDPERADAVRKFFAGSYRWLVLERDRSVPRSHNIVRVIGTFLDKTGMEQRVHIGYLDEELAEDVAKHNMAKLWSRIRFIKFPSLGRRAIRHVRFDLMVELDEGPVA